MSSITKSMLIRSTPEVCKQRLFKGKYVDETDRTLLRENHSMLRLSRNGGNSSGRLGGTRCQDWQHGSQRLFSKAKAGRYDQPAVRGEYRGPVQAILTPVSDPTPTTKKVAYKFFLLLGFNDGGL